MRLLHLYRQTLPSTRAQAIQVFRTCHALAEHGYEVTLLANRGRGARNCWPIMGLKPHPNFHLKICPVTHLGLSGLWFRHQLANWWTGSAGLVLARDQRRLLQAVERHGKDGHRIILEIHGLDSLSKPNSTEAYRSEKQCLEIADGLVANCGGTLAAWQNAHEVTLPSVVSHNGTHVEARPNNPTQDFILVLGSMRTFKGVTALLNAAGTLPYELRWVGGDAAERAQYCTPDHVKLMPPMPHAEIEALVTQARVLVAPLGDKIFSQQLTSPLKLWDYLAVQRPIVTANTACTAEIARMTQAAFHVYKPDDERSIQQALSAAWEAPERPMYRRPWSARVHEILPVFEAPIHA